MRFIYFISSFQYPYGVDTPLKRRTSIWGERPKLKKVKTKDRPMTSPIEDGGSEDPKGFYLGHHMELTNMSLAQP